MSSIANNTINTTLAANGADPARSALSTTTTAVATGGNADTASYESFDAMGLKDELLRGIYAYGFDRPGRVYCH
jgi:hypothetical protein